FFSKGEHGGELGLGEGLLFAGTLDFDELAVGGHDEVHVDGGVLVLEIIEVEEGLTIDHAHADGGDELLDGGFGEEAFFDELLDGERGGHAGAGDGGGAGAAVGLKDVAIDAERAWAEQVEIDYGAEGAADEALELDAAAVEPALGAVALFTL